MTFRADFLRKSARQNHACTLSHETRPRALCPWALTPHSLIYGAQLEVSCYISSMYGADWTAERVVDCLTVALSRPIFAGAESERLPRKDLFVIRRMTDSNHVIRKKRGRPRTGQDPVLSFRWGLDFRDAIDRWRAGEPHKPSRSEAIRWLIGQGLHVELKRRPK